MFHIKGQYTDAAKDIPLSSPGYVPRPVSPRSPFNTSQPSLCPQVTKILWKLIRVVWKNQSIPVEWQEAVGIFIPKERNSTTINQFRSIALLNVEGKQFFSVFARRMTSFLSNNHYIDTSCQKAGLSGFPGCIEHTSVIWEQIQRSKREKSERHIVWLDLANAYGSVPHKLVEVALEFFHVPACVITIIAKYFNNLRMCFSLHGHMTGWQQMSVLPWAAQYPLSCLWQLLKSSSSEQDRWPEGWDLHQEEVRGYMDDVTTILQTAPCTAQLLKRLDELIQWARMKIKPSKSRSLSIRKGVREDRTVFTAGGEKIPLLNEKSVRSLGRDYTPELSDRQVGKLVQKQLREGLEKIDSSQLPGKLKVWCYQFTLFQRVMWPLKVSKIPSSLASRMDTISNTYIRKWLGLPLGL